MHIVYDKVTSYKPQTPRPQKHPCLANWGSDSPSHFNSIVIIFVGVSPANPWAKVAIPSIRCPFVAHLKSCKMSSSCMKHLTGWANKIGGNLLVIKGSLVVGWKTSDIRMLVRIMTIISMFDT